MSDTINQETGEVTSTALALNSNEVLSSLQKEVMDEFLTSDREVYKEALRSLYLQEQKLKQQIADVESDIKELHAAKAALDDAFKNGTLRSTTDARGIVRTVRSNSASRRVDDAFED